MTKRNHLCRVWDIIEKVGVCMLTTQFSGGLRARPIEARADRDAGLIFFVTDVHSAKARDTNSVPWSTRMLDGNPISRPTLSSTAPRKLKRGSNAGEKREKVSTIVSTRNLRPVAS